MKKQLSVILASAMIMGTIAGCGQKAEETTAAATEATTAAETEAATEAETTAEETTEAETEAAAEGYKTGMAIVSSLGHSKDAGEKDGNAQVDSVAIAVVLDEADTVVDCVVDVAQTKMGFTADGKVIMSEGFKTKKELGEEYGMRSASPIGKEWFEQAAAFEEYVVGKTADEVKGIEVNEESKPVDEDLLAGCTISIGDYVEAITEAIDTAAVIGTQEGDKLGLAIITDMHKSADAAADKDGQCQAYSTYAAVTTDADGKITGALFDATQGTVKFDATGKITSDLTAGVKTKNQLGEEYGMKAVSGIGKEWNEQAAALAEYVTGKTVDEVTGIAVNEENKPTDADLAASVTMAIGDMQKCVEKAAATAK